MVTPRDPAVFLVRAAAAMARLDLGLGPDEEDFREFVIGQMADSIPIQRPLEDLHEQLLVGTDPVVVLTEAFEKQASAYSDAAARATMTLAQVAVEHLYTAGGETAVSAFLADLMGTGENEDWSKTLGMT